MKTKCRPSQYLQLCGKVWYDTRRVPRYANGKGRYFTVRESARLQTFPDKFKISGTWLEAMRQLGNAVPVKLGAAVTSSVSSALAEASA